MKKLFLTAAAVACAASVFAQGTIQLGNNVPGTVVAHIYLGAASQIGNGSNDTPAGTTSWVGFTALSGSGFRAALLAANGAGAAESSLTFGATPTIATFRGGANAGLLLGTTATLSQIAPDAAAATVELFVWDARTGVTDPSTAMTDWLAGTLAAGKSGAFGVTSVGGSVNQPPALGGLQAFSIYTVPEPSTMALAGLGAAALLIFRRRK